MMRTVVGVVIGYVIFAVSAVLLFQLTGQDPHVPVSTAFLIGSFVYGAIFAATGGYVASLIARTNKFGAALALTLTIALGATVSILSQLGKGSIWSQLGAIFIMAPSALIGGWFKLRQARD